MSGTSIVWRLALPGAVLLLAGCVDNPTSMASPETPRDAAHSAPTSATASAGRQILMLDNCDPKTFQPGACTKRTGGMSFATFIAQLEKHQRVQGWRFAPGVIHVTSTETVPILNRGGAVHDFTEVAEFGGGYSAGLNHLSGNPIPAPECVVDPEAPELERNPNVRVIAPGDQDEMTFEPGETRKYQCCLHPWMRAVSQ